MATHWVKCRICGKEFDANAEPFVLVATRRYAHKSCYDKQQEEKEKEVLDEEALDKYIKKIFHLEYVPTHMKRQINDYKTNYGYSYSGILKTLIWWFDIQKNSIEAAHNSLGIVPYVYKDAYQYYYNLYLSQNINKDKNFDKIKNPKVVIIEAAAPTKTYKKTKMFNLEG